MPDPSKQAYLARYLHGPSDEGSQKKKRKKQRHAAEGGLIIQDDASTRIAPPSDDDEQNDADESGHVVTGSRKAAKDKPAFKKAFSATAAGSDQKHALSATESAGSLARGAPDPDDGTSTPAQPAAPRSRGGLQTKDQIRAQKEERQAREAAARAAAEAEAHASAESKGGKDHPAGGETVYRDASGRKIDLEAEREQEKAEQRKRLAKEAERQSWGRGQVQLDQARRQRQELEEIKDEGVARYATDEKMNAHLRSLIREDDPALAFLTSRSTAAEREGPRLPRYSGPTPPPNRFGIQPGYRWDGVDRSNGFERQYFARINERKRRDQVAQGA